MRDSSGDCRPGSLTLHERGAPHCRWECHLLTGNGVQNVMAWTLLLGWGRDAHRPFLPTK